MNLANLPWFEPQNRLQRFANVRNFKVNIKNFLTLESQNNPQNVLKFKPQINPQNIFLRFKLQYIPQIFLG